MHREITLTLTPQEAASENIYIQYVLKELNVARNQITSFKLIKRSIDARKRNVKIILKLLVFIDEPAPKFKPIFEYQDVTNKPEVLIIGSGPAGLFAALRLIELGIKPIIFERGKDVQGRRHDIAIINRNEGFNSDSNYCFGEGGAGTFSDGKLYTRSSKRGNNQKILEVFHYHGASENILYEAHPHIGTNKLPDIIQRMRESILKYGGKIHFNSHVKDLILKDNKIEGIIIQNGNEIRAANVILATGHSARDIYELLDKKKILLEAKPFAMGVRVEHPQQLIDSIQYHNSHGRGAYLPAASYNLVTQVDGRGVYSFCMCPGGTIVPALTAEGEIVVNGMSSAQRNSYFANSGIIVQINLEDIPNIESNPLAGLEFQKSLERLAFQHSGPGSVAPAQRLLDFVLNKTSTSLPKCSYHPGLISSDLHNWLPEGIRRRLQQGFQAFEKKMPGYLTNDAIIIGVESRSSSPLRIPRNLDTLEHVQIKGLYPCGEGAGYAGGIVSSAIDGENCAEKVAIRFKSK